MKAATGAARQMKGTQTMTTTIHSTGYAEAQTTSKASIAAA